MPNFAISHSSRLVLFTAALGACTAGRESDPAPASAPETPAEEREAEPVAEAEDPSLAGWLCGGVCAAAGSLACALVSDTCIATTVVTVGSTAIPCGIAVVASCLGTAACLALCSYDTPGFE